MVAVNNHNITLSGQIISNALFFISLYKSIYSITLWKLLVLTFCASHVEPQMFPVTSLSHHHLTSIIGLLLFIYFPWQANRGEVT